MNSKKTTIIFTTLAMNQTLFFEALGRALEEHGYHPAYICFHERSHEYLDAKGAMSFNACKAGHDRGKEVYPEDVGIQNLNLLLSHEKAAFELSNTEKLLGKFQRYLTVVDSALNKLLHDTRESVYLIQELGGFVPILAAYYTARAKGIDNIFVEPSFFRGRVFFVRNSFSAPTILGPTPGTVSCEVNDYLDKVIKSQSAVIPVKDAHHYRTAMKKILDPRNMKRLIVKLTDKYLLSKGEEFEHIRGHVIRHLRMVVNSLRLRRYYRQILEAESFIYYPLHVPADVALTLRSPEYMDQYALIDFICRSVPYPYKVAIKEHPALVGAVSYRYIHDLLKRHDNLVLLKACMNNYEVLRAARVVVTVNSKSGAEALLLGKPVVVLGDAFYRHCRLVHTLDSLHDLPLLLAQLSRQPPELSRAEIVRYFQDVWVRSHPGEIYDCSPVNICLFVRGLLAELHGECMVPTLTTEESA